LLPAAPEKAAAEVRDIEGVARRSLREVREAVSGYRQPTLDEELSGAREMLHAAGIACRIENKAGPLPNITDTVLAWTVREGVTNVIRHSRADLCEIRVTQAGEEVCVKVKDDGNGSPPEDEEATYSNGSGLSGLAERVAASEGEFEAGPLSEGGFHLHASLPARSVGEQMRR
jgi:two-component system sensor histidine kinase DesK